MQTILLFDLDDTLINTRIRHYKVVENFFVRHNRRFVDYKEYLKLRRDNISNSAIVRMFDPGMSEAFQEHWQHSIEGQKYLQYDCPIVSTELLKQLKCRNYILGIVSLRSNSVTAIYQLKRIELYSYFDSVNFLAHNAQTNPKIEILKDLSNKFKVAGFVGDAETDKQAAERNNILFYGVKTGIYNSDNDYGYADVNEVICDFLKYE